MTPLEEKSYARIGATCADNAHADEVPLHVAREVLIAGFDMRAEAIDAMRTEFDVEDAYAARREAGK